MRSTHRSILIAVVAVLLLCPTVSLPQESQDYIVTVGNEQISFMPRPELGYVVKLQEARGGISALGALLSLPAGQVKPIRGLDRKGLWVVERDRPMYIHRSVPGACLDLIGCAWSTDRSCNDCPRFRTVAIFSEGTDLV